MGFLYGFFIFVLVLVSILLVAVILLQSGKGGGVAAAFGGAASSTDAIFGTRQAGNLLTKASWWLGGIFLALAFVLQIASTRRTAPKSVLDQTFRPAAPASAPATTTPGATPGAAAPALPLEQGTATTPAAPTTPAPKR